MSGVNFMLFLFGCFESSVGLNKTTGKNFSFIIFFELYGETFGSFSEFIDLTFFVDVKTEPKCFGTIETWILDDRTELNSTGFFVNVI